MTLNDRTMAFIRSLNVEFEGGFDENTPLIRTGALDSAALLNLAEWIEREVGAPLDLTSFDLVREWNTVASIGKFILHHKKDGR